MSTPVRGSSALDVDRVRAAFLERLATMPGDLQALGRRSLGELDPGQWTMEWFLPWWLGETLGLDPRTAHDLVLANVLGLASARLHDDLVDGELPLGSRAAATRLATALHREALRIHAALFPRESRVWAFIERCMAEWRAATAEGGPGAGSGVAAGPRPVPGLTRRGAPLHISAYASCLLADRMDAYPGVARCLEHALAALVLYDHACDWEEDVIAGRWNAFIAALSAAPSRVEGREPAATPVTVRMPPRGRAGATADGYFACIEAEARRGAAAADALGIAPLAAYLTMLAGRAERDATGVRSHYRHHVALCTAILFGHRVPKVPRAVG